MDDFTSTCDLRSVSVFGRMEAVTHAASDRRSIDSALAAPRRRVSPTSSEVELPDEET